jgi:serine/threonine protein kinase
MIPARIGKYEILDRLGAGGMAEIYVAKTTGAEGFARQVALKRMLPGHGQDAESCARFSQEALISSRLHHPNIVAVVDFDRDPEHGLFLVMELVRGRDLDQLLRAGRVPVPEAIYVIGEVLSALGYAHELPCNDAGMRGVVHRDVSPQNVLLSWDGAVKLSDFGLAKAHVACKASGSAVLKGKPGYLSPEQINGRPVDGRADLFSVGVMLWEMLVGQALFHGATTQEVLAASLFAPIPSPRQVCPDVPHALAQITRRLLERDPARRYQTAQAALRDLRACQAGPLASRAGLVALLHQRFGQAAAGRASEGHAPRTRARSWPSRLRAVSTVTATGLALAAVFALSNRARHDTPSPTSVRAAVQQAGARHRVPVGVSSSGSGSAGAARLDTSSSLDARAADGPPRASRPASARATDQPSAVALSVPWRGEKTANRRRAAGAKPSTGIYTVRLYDSEP